MDEHGVLLEEERTVEEETAPPIGRGWAALAAGGALLAIVVLSPSPELETAPTTFPSVPRVTVPPTMADGEIVDRTLTWTEPVGLGDARQIGGVVEHDGLYWLVGTEGRGITAWTSVDGVRWSEQGPITGTGEWEVGVVQASEEGVVVGASGWMTGSSISTVFESRDGSEWDFHSLPLADPHLAVSGVSEVFRAGDRYVAHAWVGPEPVAEFLPEPFAHLVRDGSAWAEVWPDRVRIHLQPGLLVAEIPTDDLPEYEPIPGFRRRQTWIGTDLGLMEPIETGTVPAHVVSLRNDEYVGLDQGHIRTSEDGINWERAGLAASAAEVVDWAGGVAGAGYDSTPFWWIPGRSEAELLVPERLGLDPGDFAGLRAGETVGVALLESGPMGDIERFEWNAALIGSAVYRAEIDDGGVVVTLDGNPVWADRSPDSSVSVDGDDVVFQPAEGDRFSIPIERWLAMTALSTYSRPSDGLRLIHSVDGTRWSESSWSDITRQAFVNNATLYATDDFLVAVGQSTADYSIDAVAIGTPVE